MPLCAWPVPSRRRCGRWAWPNSAMIASLRSSPALARDGANGLEPALADYPPEVAAYRITICLGRATGLIGSGHVPDGAELVSRSAIINIPVDHRSP